MKNPNFLILDEPTNDLDIVTLQTLEDFLDEFKGCVLIVSHDRYFIDRLVDHTFVMEGNGEIKDFPGNYTEYRTWKGERQDGRKNETRLELENNEIKKQEAKQKVASVVEPAETKTKNDAPVKKLSFKLQHELSELEKEIPELEKQKSEIEHQIIDSAADYAKVLELTAKLKPISDSLDKKNMRWLEISEM